MKEKIINSVMMAITALFFVVTTAIVMLLPYGVIALISTVLKGENEDE